MTDTAPFQRSIPIASPEDTSAFAEALAPILSAGDVLLLSGPVGAGKSHFARALIRWRMARAQQIEDVPSPTFTLVQSYALPDGEIWHADLYRLSDPSEVEELGLADAFEEAICLVEWPDRLLDPPENALSLEFHQTPDPGTRQLVLRGPRAWEARVVPLLEHAP